MTDKKQIKSIIQQYAEKGEKLYNESCETKEDSQTIGYWDGYRDCANLLLREIDDIQEELVSVWHNVNEKPEEVREILIYNKRDCGDSFYIALYCSDSDKVYINSRWYSLSKITKWAYLDELLKL